MESYTIYNTGFDSSVDHVTTSTMQRHVGQAHDGTLCAIIQRGLDSSIPVGERGLILIRSIDNGKTWSFVHQLTGYESFTSSLVMDSDSNIYVAYSRITGPQHIGSPGQYPAMFRKYTFNISTRTWTPGTAYLIYENADSSSTVTWINITRETVSGRIWVCWRHYQSSIDRCYIKIAYSDNDGATWTDTNQIIGIDNNKPDKYGCFVATSTFVMMVYHDIDNANVEYKKSAKHLNTDPATTWTYDTITVVVTNVAGTHYTAVADKHDTVHTTIEDNYYIGDTIRYARYVNGAWTTPEVLGFGDATYPTFVYDEENDILYGFASTQKFRFVASRSLDIVTGIWTALQIFAFEFSFNKVTITSNTVEVNLTTVASSVDEMDFFHPDTGKMLKLLNDSIECFSEVPIDYISWELGVDGVGGVVEWKYWNGTSYVSLTFSESYNTDFQGWGFVVFNPPVDWVKKSDGYPVKITVTTAYTTAPVGNRFLSLRHRRRLAVPAKINLALSNYTVPSIIREGDNFLPSTSFWEVECIVWDIVFNGGLLYIENGVLKYRGSKGTITTIASA